MSNQLGPIDITCDAPPYPIVQACNSIGIQSPEDVRWCRLGQSIESKVDWGAVVTPQIRRGGVQVVKDVCSCGSKLPPVEKFVFTYRNGAQVFYFLSQCGRCRSVFWEDA